MPGYRGHLTVSIPLGLAYGALGSWQENLDWGAAGLGAGLTALGGLLPDLDSQGSLPVREVSNVTAATAAFLLLRRLQHAGLSGDQVLVLLAGGYLFTRYAVTLLFRLLSVHRGMFHSIPGMAIAGLAVFLLHGHPDLFIRVYLAAGVMLGFLSHLVLDQLWGTRPGGRGKYVGSPLKLFSPSWGATLATYAVLAALLWLALDEANAVRLPWPEVKEQFSKYLAPPSPR